jgi:hypothetical protein
MGHDDDWKAGIAQRIAFNSVRALVELDLLTHPISRTRMYCAMEFSSMLGFLNQLFWPEPYRRTRRDVNFCLMLDEKPSVVAGGVVESRRDARERSLEWYSL